GVYLYRDAKAQVVYVGKAGSLRSRVRSYFQESRPRDAKTDALVRQIADLEYIVTDNELEALMLEANLVRKHRPRYNIILRDDKHYPFLKLTTNEAFPRLLVARRVQSDGALHFGPFYPATAMRETLRLTRQLFPLRTCSIEIDGTLPRPCIQYAIHRCNAPCTGWETREGYAKTARDVQRFLEGKNDDLALTLTRQMEEAAAEQKFERAAVLRDQIQSLNKVRERQKIISTEELDQDVLGVVRQGNDACVELFFVRKGRLVGQEPFFFDKVAGSRDGEILSAFVRQFYGKSVTPAPELLVSEELPEAELTAEWLSGLARRRVQILIDGGRGQLNVGLKVLQDLGLDYLPVIALAKQQEEVYVGERLHPLLLDPTSPALHTLQKIRDEAHRFAITYHKKLRAKRTLQSVLDTIPAVGPTIRTSLLKTLGSARRIRESSVAELAAVPKVTPKRAQRIYDHFRGGGSPEPHPGDGS